METELKPFVVTYENKQYNIASFMDKHPGGKEILEEYKDKDITAAYKDIKHSEEAATIMQRYLIAEKKEVPVKKTARKVTWAFVKEKLFTKEDKLFVHKIFGLLSLLSYAYRYILFITTGTLGFTGTTFDYVTLLVHFLLSFSSLIFHVLERRLVKNPLIIYEEYRLHAILFSLRSVLVSLLGMSNIFKTYFSSQIQQVLLVATVLTVHLMVDYVTLKHGTKGVTAVRNNNAKSLYYLKLFFAFYQFTALGSHLIQDTRLADLGFNTLIAIQSSAFLMTLKRKNVIHWSGHLFWYGLALVLSLSVMLSIKGPMFFVYIFMIFMLRIHANLSKYFVWSLYLITFFYFKGDFMLSDSLDFSYSYLSSKL